MMKTTAIGLLCLFSMLSASALEWKCKDGTGTQILKDSDNGLSLYIRTPDKVDWAREDDRGFFLSYNGGIVSRQMDSRFHFPDGMIIKIRFSVDPSKTKDDWLPLITAHNYDRGYSVWVHKKGDLLVCFPGASNWYKIIPAGIQDMRDYDLSIIRGEDRAQVVLNGKILADYASKGKLKAPGKNDYFHLGSLGGSRNFYGNIYHCSIKPFKKGSFLKPNQKAVVKKTVYPAEEIKDLSVLKLKDPAGTVILSDFNKFSPKPRITDGYASLYGWTWRQCKFFSHGSGALFAPMDPDSLDIFSCDPGLKGKYDVYLGLRISGVFTDLVVAVPNEQTRYRVRVGRAGNRIHPNTEVLIARNVEMDAGKISFFPGSHMFLGYVKFIPSNNPRKPDVPAYKSVSVQRTNSNCAERNQEQIQEFLRTGYLKERIFVGPTQTKNISERSRKRGYVLFPQDWMDLCFEQVAPVVDPGKFTLKLKAAKGEFEPVTLGVHGLENLGKITFTGGEKFKKAGIKVDITTALSFAKRTTNYVRGSEFVVAPQCLERTNVADLKKGRTKQFWITVKVPENMKAGIYRDNFVLTSSKGKEIVPVELEVRPFKLDPIGKNRTLLWFCDDVVEGRFNKEDIIREMADHGLNSLCFYEMLETLANYKRDASGRLQPDTDRPEVKRLIKVIKENGIKLLVLNTRNLVKETYNKKNGEEDFCRVINAVIATAKRDNWPELLFYGMDETLSEMAFKYPRALWEARMIKKCNGRLFHSHLWYKTARPYQKEVDVISPLVDVFCLRYNTRNLWYVDSWDKIQDEAEKRGKEVWAYNSDNAVVFAQTAMKRFSYGWFFRTIGDKTIAHSMWEYHSVSGSPYTDLDYNTTDWCYNFPENKIHKGGFSLDYESLREGVDDLRYICTLENSIAKAKKRGINTASAEKLLSDLKKSFDFGDNFKRKSPFLTSSFEKVWEENGKRYCSGSFNLPNGWTFADYHAAREKIAAEIIKLNQY